MDMASEAADPSSSGAGAPEEIKISRSIRSCRGCLLYSSIMRERGRNPVCLGLSRSTDAQAYIPDGKMDNEVARNFRNFTDFKYACIGYSTHKEVNSNQLTQPTDSTNELPYCFGLEFLADRKPTTQAVPSTETAPYTNSPPPPKPLVRGPCIGSLNQGSDCCFFLYCCLQFRCRIYLLPPVTYFIYPERVPLMALPFVSDFVCSRIALNSIRLVKCHQLYHGRYSIFLFRCCSIFRLQALTRIVSAWESKLVRLR